MTCREGGLDGSAATPDEPWAVIALVGALRGEPAQAYARFTSACLAMGEGGGGAADAR